MKQFEVGKSYTVNDINQSVVTVTKRTKHFATISGDFTGRFYIYRDNFFGLGEELLLPAPKGNYFCFAGKEVIE